MDVWTSALHSTVSQKLASSTVCGRRIPEEYITASVAAIEKLEKSSLMSFTVSSWHCFGTDLNLMYKFVIYICSSEGSISAFLHQCAIDSCVTASRLYFTRRETSSVWGSLPSSIIFMPAFYVLLPSRRSTWDSTLSRSSSRNPYLYLAFYAAIKPWSIC